MGSNTAFLLSALPSATVVQSNDSLMSGMASYDQSTHSMAFKIPGFTPRSFASSIENLHAIGIDVDEDNPIFKALKNIIVVNYSLLMLNQARIALVHAHAAREWAMAAFETGLIVGIPYIGWSQAWRIPIAAAAMGMVYAAYGTGKKLGSGEWDFHYKGYETAQDRRYLNQTLATVPNLKFMGTV